MKRLVVLISGQGRNCQALIDACAAGRIPARIISVISNKAEAAGLEKARAAGIPVQVIPHGNYPDRESFDAALMQVIDAQQPDIVVLAGFMRILTPGFVRHYLGRMLNIHPSLLPRHPGIKTHQKVLEAGDAHHGATVHFVTEELDGGPAIIQGQFSVDPQDDAARLAGRVMQEVELKIYPQAVNWMARGELQLNAGQTWFRGQPLARPLTMTDVEPEFR